jgi:hypothetical protein
MTDNVKTPEFKIIHSFFEQKMTNKQKSIQPKLIRHSSFEIFVISLVVCHFFKVICPVCSASIYFLQAVWMTVSRDV